MIIHTFFVYFYFTPLFFAFQSEYNHTNFNLYHDAVQIALSAKRSFSQRYSHCTKAVLSELFYPVADFPKEALIYS